VPPPKKRGKLCLILLFIFGLASCNSKPFQNLKGEETSIEIKKDTKAVVYFFLVPDCPFSQLYSMSVNQVYSVYSTKGFQFYGIVPGNLYSISEIDSFIFHHNFIPKILIDPKYNFTKKYKVTVVPQVIVTDIKGQVLYAGKIDDQAIAAGQKKYQPTKFYLLDALKNISEGKDVGVKKTKAVGCFIE
jgi:peroxiredoxin